MAVTTKKVFPATTNTTTTTFGPIGIELNNQDDLDVYITESGGSRILQYKQSTASTTDSNHPQVNDTTGLYFPPVSSGVTLKNYTLSADNNNIIFNSALPNGAVVTAERRTRDESGDYTAFSAGSTIRSTDLNTAFDEVRFTAQEGRNKAFDLENQLDHRDITVGPGKGIEFEGSTIDGNETKLVVTDPTADRTVTIPDQSGNVIVSGNASIVNADVSPNAEIAVSKLGDGAARQVLQTASNGSDVEWTSNVDIPGTLDVTSTAAFDSNVTISGNSTVGGTLGITGTTTAAAINASGAVGVDGDFDVNTNKFTVAASTGNTTIAGTLTVTGTTNLAANSIGTAEIADDAINAAKIAANAVNSSELVNGSVITTKIADNAITATQIANNAVERGKILNDAVNGSKIADDSIDSEHYVDGSIDTIHIATNAITATQIANNAIERGKILNDAVNGSKIADDSIDSEHYVDGSIDTVHIADNAITATQIANNAVERGQILNDAVNGSKIADDSIDSEHYVDGSIDNAHIANDAVTIDKIADAAIVTNSEQGSHTANDTTFYTTAASDARYYNIGSLEEIQSGETWAADDAKIATTAAIDARIVDLVDDVGGFVPIANETSFPSANPDVNNGTGTLVSIKALASNLVSNGSGVATITNGAGSGNNVTITGLANSTTYPAGRGMLVETSATSGNGSANPPRAYTFHRQLAEATATTTVANSISNVNTCATNISNINAVAADATDIGVVAGKETEIGRLGTADAVADMNTLATTAIVADLETCADNNANISTTAGAISNVNTVAGAISNVNTTAGAISNVNTTATNIANVNTTATNIANVNTVGSNIGTVNDFAARYRGPQSNANEYDTSLDVGDLYFNTTINALKVYTGATDGWVAGVTQTGDYALKTGSTYTGNNTHNDGIKSIYGTSGDGLEIHHTSNNSYIKDNGTGALYIDGSSIRLRNYANSNTMAEFIGDGEVKLYYNNGWRVKTTNSGIQMNGDINLGDGNRVKIGAGDDLQIYHSSDTSNIVNSTGHFTISNSAASSHLYLQARNGEESIIAERDGAVKLYYDNAIRLKTTANGVTIDNDFLFDNSYTGGRDLHWQPASDRLAFFDNVKATFGDGVDLQLYHNGSNSVIQHAGGGHLYVQTTGTDEDLILKANRDIYIQPHAGETGAKFVKNGDVQLYYDNGLKFKTTSSGAMVVGGEGSEATLEIYADEGDDNADKWRIRGETSGNLNIQNMASGSWETAITGVGNGAVELRYDNSKKFETASNGGRLYGSKWGMGDDVQLRCGTSDDLRIFHGSNTNWIQTHNDHALKITKGANSELLAQFTPDGSVDLYYNNSKKFETTSTGATVSGDDLLLSGGGHSKLKLLTTGTSHATGIQITHASGDAAQQVWQLQTDGTADGDLKLRNATSSTDIFYVQPDNNVRFQDDRKIRFGNSALLEIYSNGTNSWINNSSGALIISGNDLNFENAARNETYIECDNGSDVSLYYDNSKKLETTSTGISVSGDIDGIPDGSKILVGTHDDMQLYHTSNSSYIKASNHNIHLDSGTTSAIRIISGGSTTYGKMADFNTDGSVDLYYDNSKKFETSLTGITVTGNVDITGSFSVDDSEKFVAGNDSDLEIYHNGSNSFVENKYTGGHLYLRNNGPVDSNVYIQARAGEHSIICHDDGGVGLYYNNLLKLETWNDGIIVKGREGSMGGVDIYADEGDDNADKWRLKANTSGEFQLQNYSTGSWVKNINVPGNNAVELYHSGNWRFGTSSDGAIVGGSSSVAELKLNTANGANQRAKIQATNGNEVIFYSGADERIWDYDNNGEFAAYYDNSKKLKTTSGGIDVTGSITVNGSALSSGLFSSYAVIAYVRADGTNSGTFSSGAWRTRGLNTEVHDPDGIVSISSNQFTLGAGSYLIQWSNSAYRTNRTASRCQNVTDGTTAGRSQEFFAASYDNGSQDSSAWGAARASFSGSKAFEIQAYCDTSRGTNGFGVGSPGSNDMYDLVVTIIKES